MIRVLLISLLSTVLLWVNFVPNVFSSGLQNFDASSTNIHGESEIHLLTKLIAPYHHKKNSI